MKFTDLRLLGVSKVYSNINGEKIGHR